jgi:carbamoyltransferase
MNVASSIQKVTETVIIKICKHIKHKYKSENLCIAGGVGLNCVANGVIKKLNLFNNIWIQPASGDAGGALGAALGFYYQHEKKERKIDLNDSMRNSYLGPNFTNKEIKNDFEKNKIVFDEMNNISLVNYIAEEIKNGKIVGWLQGNQEFGPRALGNRSIIADPRSEDMQKRLNLKTKFRESFRPFAPIVLEDKVSEWF